VADVGAKFAYPVPAAIDVAKKYHPVVSEAGARIELEIDAFHPS
jgi:hypothetical protein